MYVCICNAIRSHELRAAVRRCGESADAEDIYISLGRPPQCRQCIDDAQAIIDDERLSHRLPACVN